MQIKLSVSSSHRILPPCQPVPVLTVYLQEPRRWPLECHFLGHWYEKKKKRSTAKAGSERRSASLWADALTTRPKRRQGTRNKQFTAVLNQSLQAPDFSLGQRLLQQQAAEGKTTLRTGVVLREALLIARRVRMAAENS